jgi:integrase
MAPRRRSPQHKNLPENLYLVGPNRSGYRYKHPQTGKMHGMGSDKVKAIAAAKKLNAILIKPADLVKAVLHDNEESISACVNRYRKERQSSEDMAPATVKLENYRLNAITKELGHYLANELTVKICADWLDSFQGNAYTKHRGTLVKVFRFAVSKGLMNENLAEKTLTSPRNSEKKIRQVLSKPQYDLIYDKAPDWLKIAMALALITLQRRGDIVRARYSDLEGGVLQVIQAKTEKHGYRAFLKIKSGDALLNVVKKSRDIIPLCPFIIHRLPKRRVPFLGQEHHAQITGEYLGKEFKKVRDSVPEIKDMPAAQRPTFHEIRALGGSLYLEQGFSKEYVNLLMGHTSQKMTDEYTDQHQNWTECEASLKLH